MTTTAVLATAKLASAAQIEPIQRIADHLATETAALRAFAPCDLAHGNQLKSQALLELTRHARRLQTMPANADLRAALVMLRERLIANQEAVRVHLDAARTLTSLMVGAIERDASDRTYSRQPYGRQ